VIAPAARALTERMTLTSKQKQGVVLALAGVLAITAIVRAWFESGAVKMGLWGIDAGGHGIRWDNVAGAQDDHYLAGYVACAAALAGAALASAAVLGKPALATRARQLLTIAIVAIAYFLVRAFADGVPSPQLSWAAVLGPAAAVGLRWALRR
jgi:hypothetical protein